MNKRALRVETHVVAMDAKDLGEVIERSVRCTKNVCADLQRGVMLDPQCKEKKRN